MNSGCNCESETLDVFGKYTNSPYASASFNANNMRSLSKLKLPFPSSAPTYSAPASFNKIAQYDWLFATVQSLPLFVAKKTLGLSEGPVEGSAKGPDGRSTEGPTEGPDGRSTEGPAEDSCEEPSE